MNFWFTVKEGLKGFKRARLATFLTISSVTFSHFLVGLAVIAALNIDSWIENVRSKLEVEVFLETVADENDISRLEKQLSEQDQVQAIRFISKEDAARRFEKEFGRNIYDVLQVNPLPASFVITLKPEARHAEAVGRLGENVRKMGAVDEVVYQSELIALIDRYRTFAYFGGGLGLLLLSLVTIVLLYNTIRLTIFARRDIIEIMKLVGARKAFIKRPFVVEGILQGIIGAALACLLLFAAQSAFTAVGFLQPAFKKEVFGGLMIMGFFIGYLASRMSVAKYLENTQ